MNISLAKQNCAKEQQGKDVAIVIVNYNGFDDIKRCLATIDELDSRDFITIIVDNDSPDGSGRLIAEQFKAENRIIICNDENSGFAGGNNVGIRRALSLGTKYIWLLNPDTEVEPSSLSSLKAELAKSEDTAAVGSKVLFGEDKLKPKIWSSGGYVERDAGLSWMRGTDEADLGQYDRVEECTYLAGCSLLVRASIFKDVGLIPERYFMYFEETDWCLQVKDAGYSLKYVPSSVIYHHVGDAKMQGPLTVYYYNRNERLFWLKFGTWHYRLKIWLKALVRDLPRVRNAYRSALGTENESLFRAHYRSVVDSLLFRSGKRWP